MKTFIKTIIIYILLILVRTYINEFLGWTFIIIYTIYIMFFQKDSKKVTTKNFDSPDKYKEQNDTLLQNAISWWDLKSYDEKLHIMKNREDHKLSILAKDCNPSGLINVFLNSGTTDLSTQNTEKEIGSA